MKAKSIKGKSTEEIQSALQESMADGFKPTLAIIFLSISQNRKDIAEILSKVGVQIFGVTTNGEFTDETPEKLSTAILLLDMNTSYFKISSSEYLQNNFREVAYHLALEAKKQFKNPAFLIAGSNSQTDAEALLQGFVDATNAEVDIYGGMAGDDVTFTKQYVFTNQWESNKGLVVLALDGDNILIKGKATCGWKAVGTEKTVTKSEGTHVYTIEDVP
ncbi:MAG: FIST N-terminal domain-containing protein, partial [Chitinophagaceae bacterium]